MSRLLCTLPPLAPDYSGAASVFHDLKFLTVIHDASGCTGTYTGYDEPRWFGSSSPVFCSGLREMDAIMGDDEKLLARIDAALEDTKAPGAVIIGSPVPLVIGFDFKGFASLVERRAGVPAFAFPATGLRYYDWGQREAYRAIARRLLAENPVRDPLRVNLLGASVLDGFDDPALDALEDLIQSAGLRRGAVWGARSPLEEIRETGGAGANWVLSAAALPLARLLRERWGTPFVAGLPIGKGEEERIRAGLAACVRGAEPEAALPPAPRGTAGKIPRTLILGEALFCSSLRAWLLAGGGKGTLGSPLSLPRGGSCSGPGTFSSPPRTRRSAPWRDRRRRPSSPIPWWGTWRGQDSPGVWSPSPTGESRGGFTTGAARIFLARARSFREGEARRARSQKSGGPESA